MFRSMTKSTKPKVVIAGAGGASLGTETLKALTLSGRYSPVVADVSPLAYGLYQPEAQAAMLLRREHYMADLISYCHAEGAALLIPGAEATLKLIDASRDQLQAAGIQPLLNRPEVIAACSDKGQTFGVLSKLGLPVPQTRVLTCEEDVEDFPMPCIIKPATDTGGSAMVSAAASCDEAIMYARWIWSAGLRALAQEYLPHEGGEFTVGVLRLGGWTASIAMRREFPCKLSYLVKNERFLISSGYSQGLIDTFPEVCRQAERIAVALDSQGPLNIQGRWCDGVFHPFEINPRFSATTYLRAMAGFHEIELFLDHLAGLPVPETPPGIKPGYYLRSLTEIHVPTFQIRHTP
jgi:carbamoyl-phosphate synthase large subunit